jgi:hypothetical protein
VRRDHGPRRRAEPRLGGVPRPAGGRPAAGTLLTAAVLLGALAGTPTGALSQEGGGGGGGDRLGEVERKVEDAEDVIVEQVLALRRRLEDLEARVRTLETELAALRGAPSPRR